MYTFSRHIIDFYIAGFTFWEGLEVFGNLKVGSKLELRLEPENPFVPKAVALFFEEKKLGYIPQAKNSQIHQLLYFGHNILEVFVCQIDLDEHPERQVRVVIKLIDTNKR